MRHRLSRPVAVTLALLAAGAVGVSGANAQTISRSTFEYQGRLTSAGQNYTGSATFRCTLYDAESDGTVVAGPLTVSGTVTNGVFTIPLDFGVIEPQGRRWAEIEVSTPTNPAFQALTPRQPVDVVPRAASAIRAESAEPFVLAFNPSPLAIDQSQTTFEATGLALTGSIWQSFTTGSAGNLTHIAVRRSDADNYSGAILNIYAGTGIGGAKLWSQRCVATGVTGEIVLPLTRALPLTGGATYTFEIVTGSGTTAFSCSTENPYSGGQANLGPNVDFYFKTYFGSATGDLSLRSRFFGVNEGLPTAPLHVTGGSGGNPLPQMRVSADAAAPFGSFLSMDATRIAGGHDWVMFSTGGSAAEGAGKLVFRDLTSTSYGLTMASNGFIGVRNFNPEFALDALGSAYTVQRIQSTNTAGTWLALGNLSPGGRYWNLISTGSGNGQGAGKFLLGSSTSPTAIDSAALTVTTTGLLGVLNAFPTFSVDAARSGDGNVIRASSDAASTALSLANSSAGGRVYSLLSNGNNAGTFSVRDLTAGAERFTIYSNGRIGVGATTSPAGLIDATANSTSNIAVIGRAGPGASAIGIYGTSSGPGTRAGQFDGNVTINGNLLVNGSVGKTSGSFRIPHPLEPEKKWLYHSFVESPDMMNIYNGIARLDQSGEATITLPNYFEALNREFRYQLTPVGASMPNLYVAEEISANTFKIAGGKPGAKVSWQVTGIRQDKDAREHPIVPEVERTDMDN
jgi:hypothetical protein